MYKRQALYQDKGLQLQVEPGLREIDLGEWEDVPWAEIAIRWPQEYECWEKHPERCCVPGGETQAELRKRLRATFDRLVEQNRGKTIAIVSHGAAIRALLGSIADLPIAELPALGWCDNTAVSYVCVGDDDTPRLIYKYDNSHLGDFTTLGKQTWWRDGNDAENRNLWYQPAILPGDEEKLACLLYTSRCV